MFWNWNQHLSSKFDLDNGDVSLTKLSEGGLPGRLPALPGSVAVLRPVPVGGGGPGRGQAAAGRPDRGGAAEPGRAWQARDPRPRNPAAATRRSGDPAQLAERGLGPGLVTRHTAGRGRAGPAAGRLQPRVRGVVLRVGAGLGESVARPGQPAPAPGPAS